MNTEPYTRHDYTGEFNLLLNEKNVMKKALVRSKGRITRAAKLIGVSKTTFDRQVKRHNLYEFRESIKSDRYTK